MAAARINPFQFIVEPIMDEPTYIQKPMFGATGCYLNGLLVIVLCPGEPPFNGVLVPTSHEHHASLMKDFPALSPHVQLGKWLFLPDTHEDFESVAAEIVERIAAGDPRLGVEPKPKTKKGVATRGRVCDPGT